MISALKVPAPYHLETEAEAAGASIPSRCLIADPSRELQALASFLGLSRPFPDPTALLAREFNIVVIPTSAAPSLRAPRRRLFDAADVDSCQNGEAVRRAEWFGKRMKSCLRARPRGFDC